jgi:predicted PurR-regulated permease PerM
MSPPRSDKVESNPRVSAVPNWLEVLGAYAWRFLLIAAATYVLIFLIVRLRLVFIPVFVALLVATLLVPPTEALRRRGWNSLLATWTVLLAGILLIGGVIALLVPAFAGQLDDLGQDLREGTDRALEFLRGPLDLTDQEIQSYVDRAQQEIGANSGIITGGVISGVTKTGEFLAGALLVVVLVFFFVKDGAKISGWFLRQFSAGLQSHISEMARRSWVTLTAYVRGTAIIALADGILIGIALVVVGNPLALPLAVITFFGAFFPIVGAVLAGAIAALVTLVTNGITDALIITAVIIAIQQVEGDVLQPIVMGRFVRLHPLVILLALTAGGILAGIAGAFIAVPLTAVGANVGNYLRSLERDRSGDVKERTFATERAPS